MAQNRAIPKEDHARRRKSVTFQDCLVRRAVGIEDKGSGTALIQQLRSESHSIPYPTAFVPKDDKLTRLHAQSAHIEAGHVLLPERAPWLEDVRTEIAAFPQGRHDDQVDANSQFIAWHFERRRWGIQQVPLGGI